MKTMTKALFGAASALALFTGPALADNDYGGFSGAVAVTSDYRYRGIAQSDMHPTVQGTINWAGEDGWYVGAWASGVDFNDLHSTTELDIYGGKHFDLGGTDLNIEAYGYIYPDQPNGAGYSFYETIVGLTHSFGALTVGATAAWSPDFFGGADDGWWVTTNATYAATDWLNISANVGHQWQDPFADYTEYDVGGTLLFSKFALDVRYVGMSDKTAVCGLAHYCDDTVVATLTYNIP